MTAVKNVAEESPPIDKNQQDLIIRFAKENKWGYKRIQGELKKLGYISHVSTIRRLLKKRMVLNLLPTGRQPGNNFYWGIGMPLVRWISLM
jgi:hypothetical protein